MTENRFNQMARTVPAPTVPQNPPVLPKTPTTPRFNPKLLIPEIFRRILDAGSTAPAWQDEINPLTRKPYKTEDEYKLTQLLTKDQRKTINNTQTETQLKYATDSTRDEKRGCVFAQLPRSGTPVKKIVFPLFDGRLYSY